MSDDFTYFDMSDEELAAAAEGEGIRELPWTDEGFECCRNQGTAFCDHGPGPGF